MKLYAAKSLDDIAEHFERNATNELARTSPEFAKSYNKHFTDRAAVWTEAAKMLREMEFIPEPKA